MLKVYKKIKGFSLEYTQSLITRRKILVVNIPPIEISERDMQEKFSDISSFDEIEIEVHFVKKIAKPSKN